MGAAGAVDVLEAAYELETDVQPWLMRLAEASRPAFDRGHGIIAVAYRFVGERQVMMGVASAGVDRDFHGVVQVLADSTPAGAMRRVLSHPSTVSTSSEMISSMGGTRDSREAYARTFRDGTAPFGFGDVLHVTANDPSGYGVGLSAPLPALGRVTRRDRDLFSRVAAHLAASMRLRALIRGEPAAKSPSMGGIEAVMRPDGKLEHATGPASDGSRREALAFAARAIDRARGRLRRTNPVEALELWKGLVAGRWTLVDTVESDGKRLVVARRNDPQPDPGVLSLRERQVVSYVAGGHSNKLVAYELGISPSTVAALLRRALTKLGVRTRLELIAALSPR